MIRAAYESTLRKAVGGAGGTTTRRALILRDSLTFLALGSITLLLYGATLLLFRSFEGHRESLATRWAERGRTDLQQHQPKQAVASLRASLAYAPDDYATQLLLAQALANAGETDQATNYFLNLHATRPGDGLLNLQLARLARGRHERQHAIDYYRASIFGDWPGDGIERRRGARLELIDYLIESGDVAAARAEVLIAAGNAPDTLELNMLFGRKLQGSGDLADALQFYKRAIADSPQNPVALEEGGQAAYATGDFRTAHEWMARGLEFLSSGDAQFTRLAGMARDAGRLGELSLSRELPARERARHLLAAAQIAQARLDSCGKQSAAGGQSPPDLVELQTSWRAATEGSKRNALAENAAGQDTLTDLIFDTERQTAKSCGAPTGDDALLLKLADSAQNGGPR